MSTFGGTIQESVGSGSGSGHAAVAGGGSGGGAGRGVPGRSLGIAQDSAAGSVFAMSPGAAISVSSASTGGGDGGGGGGVEEGKTSGV